jgi:hypothetical protein
VFYITAVRLVLTHSFLGVSVPVDTDIVHGYTKEDVDTLARVISGEGAHLLGEHQTHAGIALVHALLNGQDTWGGSISLLATTRWNGYDARAPVLAWAAERAEVALVLRGLGYDYANGAVYVLSYQDLESRGSLDARSSVCFSFENGTWALYGFKKEDWPL